MQAPTPEPLVLAALVIPFAGAALIPVFHDRPNLREMVTLLTALALFAAVLGLVPPVLAGARPEALNFEVVPGLALAFEVEPLGLLFALVASALWIVTSIYSIGYMRGHDEPRQTSYYVCFAVALGSTMAIAFAKNLFTLFLFYEALTLSTYPLVTHKADAEALRAGRIYLIMLLGTSMVLLLPAIVATWVLAGTIDFAAGGILAGKASGWVIGVLLFIYVFGIGKAAIMPLHWWLPAAMVAPTPVSALLHAVAVVKAGVFAVLKVVIYIFGLDLLQAIGASHWLGYVAGATIIIASLVAMTQDNLKLRLAYSTVSQLSYIVLGAMLATTAGVVGGAMHIAMHAFGKITLFFCAGAIMVASHKTEISEMQGLGWRMPFTFTAFFLASLSIIGLPPMGGAWSKWELALGAAETGQTILVAILMVSSLLNVAYLIPIAARAFLPMPSVSAAGVNDPDRERGWRIHEAPLLCVAPLCLTALGCVALFFYADRLYAFLQPLGAG
jgi:multicomponent Na+:H+ antiporter subunit D